ncbi:rhodanese-like domain-containing protein [Alteribacillus sp. YIM 98480]|uniref:rhodanese-like domain-containing protein n=1 Tax=Alteribacillus sp. YIM 98480 TaxID=2606599 RepID=UPI00351AD5A0
MTEELYQKIGEERITKEAKTNELAEKIKNGEDVHVIDVGGNNEVVHGKIPGARHIPLAEILDRLGEIDRNQHYYIVCRSGGRYGKAGEFLTEKEYIVTNVNGGKLIG